jgi:cytochrome b involved in lipid metabolism
MKKNLSVLLVILSTVVFSACSQQSTPSTSTNTSPATNSTTNNSGSETSYTMAQVSQHNSKSDCWLVITGSVYDVTKFIPDHPGGDEILKGCGKDATSLFQGEREHQGSQAQSLLPTFKIGVVSQK